jgi:hypothetical protein
MSAFFTSPMRGGRIADGRARPSDRVLAQLAERGVVVGGHDGAQQLISVVRAIYKTAASR